MQETINLVKKVKPVRFRRPARRSGKLPGHTQDTFSYISHTPSKKILKRAFDAVFSTVALVCASPLFLIFTLCIRISSPGPAIYSQVRVGRGGRQFRCYKLRTMHADADKRLKELLEKDPSLQKEWERTQKLKKDPRIAGKLGLFLRKTSMDELPQFWNVLKGDLSVVGPRPMLPSEIAHRLGERAPKILSVKPGLTGIWQISGRSKAIDYATRIAMDEEYVEKNTLLMDISLILKTVPCILLSKGV